jgi:hypothetical protein
MDGAQRSVLREGVVAGVIGAVIVAAWFLVVDAVRGQPLQTPQFLGEALFFGVRTPVGLHPSLPIVLGYTVVHGLAFIAFGIIAAAVLAASEAEPTLVIAVVILFAAFETFFLGVVGVLGRAAQDLLPWWEILVANFLAAVAMLWYFVLRHRRLPALLVGSWAGVLREGVGAGLVGAGVVAVWFLAIDAVQGEPLRTPRMLGGAFLRIWPALPAVVGYSLVHGLAFIVFGIVAAALVAAAEREPMFAFAVVILFTAFEVFFFAAIVIGARWVLDELSAWTIFVGNLLAAAAMLAYFFKAHRALAGRVAGAWSEDE